MPAEATGLCELFIYFVGSVVVTVLCGGGGVELSLVVLFFFLSISWEGGKGRGRTTNRCCSCCCSCCPGNDNAVPYVFDYDYNSEEDSALEDSAGESDID